MKKLLIILGNLSFIFIGLYFGISASGEQTISDDLYVAYPKGNDTFAIDISQNSGSADYLSLITYAAHGRGNQLLGYEYREKENGYIIYSASKTQNVIGSTSNSTAKVSSFENVINNLTEFSDEYIWDITKVDNRYCTIKNRKTQTYISVSTLVNEGLIKLEPLTGSDTQLFKLKTMNGIYKIRSVHQPNMGWDIEGGVEENKNIINYTLGQNQENQQWMVLFKPNDDAYVIANYKKRNLIVNQQALGSQPRVIKNNTNYEDKYDIKNTFFFNARGENLDGFNLVNIRNNSFTTYVYQKDNTSNGVSKLFLSPWYKDIPTQEWIFDKIADLPQPQIKNVRIVSSISNDSGFYYVGEKLQVLGDFMGHGFETFDLYSKFDLDKSALTAKAIPIDSSGNATFSSLIDTSKYKEGTYFIEFYARADSMFQSNRVANKYKLVFPTPTGEAIPQSIIKGTPINSLNPSSFVKNLKDEIGSDITVKNLTGIDTNNIGLQIAKVTIKNDYKESVIDVPVTVEKEANLSWSDEESISSKVESIDKSTIIDGLAEDIYWKSSVLNKKCKLVVKKGNQTLSTSLSLGPSSVNSWKKSTIRVAADDLNYGENILTIDIYNLDNAENITGDYLDRLSLIVTMTGSLKLKMVPGQLSWTGRTSGNSKGILTRDIGNTMTLSVIDTRNLSNENKTWSLRAQTTFQNTVPFDLVWKDNPLDSAKSLAVAQQVFLKETGIKNGYTYSKTWNESTGVLLSSNSYLKVGNYSGIVVVNWQLYDTVEPG